MKKMLLLPILWLFLTGYLSLAQNPLLEPFNTPHGIIPFEKVELEHILPAFHVALEEDRKQVQAIIDNPQPATSENTIDALARVGQKREMISLYAQALGSAYSNPELNQIVAEVSRLRSDYFNEMLFNEKLFDRVKKVYLQKESISLTREELTLVENYYRWFARNGNELSDMQKGRLKEIRSRRTELSVIFGQNVTQDRDRTFFHLTSEEDLGGLPDWVIAASSEYAQSKGVEGWAFPIGGALTWYFSAYSEKRELREKLHRESRRIGNNDNEFNNLEHAREILNLRLEMAQMLGFASYAEYVLEEQMAGTPAQVISFLDEYKDKVKPIAQKEIENIRNFALNLGFDDIIREWDFDYYAEKYNINKFQFNPDEVKPWLPVDHVVRETFAVIKDMWGLDFKENHQLPKYHPDVIPYEIFDANGEIKAVMYLDLFEREGKSGGARLGTLRFQNKENGANEISVSYNLCNFQKPVGDDPAMMTLWDLSIFLHEMGHGLHLVLSDVTYRSVSGYNLRYSDFVELPSMLLEKWAYQPEFLKRVGKHYQTGEPLSDEIIEKIILNHKEGRALMVMQFMIPFAAMDIALHDIQEPFKGDMCKWESGFIHDYSFLPVVEGLCVIPSFTHIFAGGYASGFYTYDWSDMMAWDIFNEFKKNGIFDPATSKRFGEEILSKGGTVHPRELFINFMGREPGMDAFLKSFDE
ncbi:MAG: M3 family metallopeptidase [Bacteroidales bacterium]